MEFLRDPIWQFIGVVLTALVALPPVVIWLRRKRNAAATRERDAEIIAHLSKNQMTSRRGYEKHKKRKGDGILLGNLSSDFLNQFPVPLGVLAAHLDRIYTPENFGATDWVTVFRRLAAEGYFVAADGSLPEKLQIDTGLDSGPKLGGWLKMAAQTRRSIQGLD